MFKLQIFRSYLVAFALVIAASFSFAQAGGREKGGSSIGGGGHSVAAHFAAVITRIDEAFARYCDQKGFEPNQKLCQNLRPFHDAAQSVFIYPQKTVVGPNDEEREAGNDGENAIAVSLELYPKLARHEKNFRRVVSLAAHETSVIAELEKNDQYLFSTPLIDAILTLTPVEELVGERPNVITSKRIFKVSRKAGISGVTSHGHKSACTKAKEAALADSQDDCHIAGFDYCYEVSSSTIESKNNNVTLNRPYGLRPVEVVDESCEVSASVKGQLFPKILTETKTFQSDLSRLNFANRIWRNKFSRRKIKRYEAAREKWISLLSFSGEPRTQCEDANCASCSAPRIKLEDNCFNYSSNLSLACDATEVVTGTECKSIIPE